MRFRQPEASVVLYTRQGCHLCDVAKDEIEKLRGAAVFRLELVDIDADEELRRQFNDEVPVVFINGRKAFKYKVEPKRFLKLIEK